MCDYHKLEFLPVTETKYENTHNSLKIRVLGLTGFRLDNISRRTENICVNSDQFQQVKLFLNKSVFMMFLRYASHIETALTIA